MKGLFLAVVLAVSGVTLASSVQAECHGGTCSIGSGYTPVRNVGEWVVQKQPVRTFTNSVVKSQPVRETVYYGYNFQPVVRVRTFFRGTVR